MAKVAQSEVMVGAPNDPLILITKVHLHHDHNLSNVAVLNHFGITFRFPCISYYYSRAIVKSFSTAANVH